MDAFSLYLPGEQSVLEEEKKPNDNLRTNRKMGEESYYMTTQLQPASVGAYGSSCFPSVPHTDGT